MMESCLKWSCEYRKFLKILSSKVNYRERLGHTLNSAWYLNIDFETDPDTCPLYFDFELERENFTEDATVIVRLISNAMLKICLNLSFGHGIEREFIEQLKIENLKDKLDIIFIFQDNGKARTLLKETSSIETDCLGKDLMSLLHKKHLADVTLTCGSESMLGHKAVLCARSPVFEAIFRNEMQESKTNTVTIDAVDASVFRAWVYFMYGDEVSITSTTFACGLLDAAEKYQMKGLKKICMEYLESNLSTDNAINLLKIANLYDDQFKTNVISFIVDNFSDLKRSEEWCNLKSRDPGLALEVYAYEDT